MPKDARWIPAFAGMTYFRGCPEESATSKRVSEGARIVAEFVRIPVRRSEFSRIPLQHSFADAWGYRVRRACVAQAVVEMRCE